MKLLRTLAVIPFVLAAACGGDDPTKPTVTVTAVTVSPSSATISQPGQTAQLAATVIGSDGSTLSGQTVEWSSSDAAVATVSGSGLVTGVAAGTSAITATAGGKAGSAVVTVNDLSQECAAAETVSLAPGGSAVYDASVCLLLPSGSGGDRYRVAVYRPTFVPNASDVTTVSLRVTGLGVSQAAPPAPAPARVELPQEPIPGLSPDVLRRDLERMAATRQAHLEQMRAAETMWLDAGATLLPSRPAGPPRVVQRADSPDKLQLDPRRGSSCAASHQPVTALRIGENDHLVIYQDSTQNASTPVTSVQAQMMLDYYGSYGQPYINSYFGTPQDIDGNGKIVMFVTPDFDSNTAAEVWTGDFRPQSECGSSNEMEVMYFNNVIIQALTDDDPSYQALAIVAHEAKHVVGLYHRIAATRRMGSSQYHGPWIEEGTAEIAAEISSRAAWAAKGGPAVGATLTRDHFVASGITPENYAILLHMARTIFFLSSQPNSLVVTPTGADELHDVYGTGWNFHRWLGDSYGNAATPFADASLFREQSDSLSVGGVVGLEHLTGKSYEDLLEEFYTAVMLHGMGPEHARAFTTYDFITATNVLVDQPNGLYPWPVTEKSSSSGTTTPASFGSATYSGPTGPAGVRIHDFRSNGTGTGAQIEVDAVSPAKILVVRVN